MKRSSTSGAAPAAGLVGQGLEEMTASFERFCLAAGLETLGALMEADATALCGPRHGRGAGRPAQRWGQPEGPSGFHAGQGGAGGGPDWLSWRQGGGGAPTSAAGRPGDCAADLGAGGGGGLAGPLGDEPDDGGGADAPLWPGGAAAGGGRAVGARVWGVEVGGVAAVRGAVGGADGGVAVAGPVGA